MTSEVKIMDYYNHLYNHNDINMILDNINETFNRFHKNTFPWCHGRYHTMFVVDTVEYILKSLSYDARTVELGKIAALLHDIGMIAGRWEHGRKSAALSSVIFDGSDHLIPDEKQMLIQAIEDHSKGANISSAVGAALIIADKIDFSKRRILAVDITSDSLINCQKIENVKILISGDEISISTVTTDDFDKNLFVNEYKPRYKILEKAVEFLGCSCKFQLNEVEERLA